MTPTRMTRQQYRAAAALQAGWYWDWLHSGPRGSSPSALAWAERTDAEATEDRDALMAAAGQRYLAGPVWTPKDASECAADFDLGARLRRTLKAQLLARKEA